MPSFNEAETVASTLDLSAGQLVKGRYRIIRPLGGGGFGAVYLTEDVALGNRPVVVKLLHREMLANPAARMKFDDEKMALIKLSERRHPGIGDIYDSGALPDGAPFLAMASFRASRWLISSQSRRKPDKCFPSAKSPPLSSNLATLWRRPTRSA